MPLSITVKSVLNKTKRRDPWFLDDYTVNPYSGCSFNCWFCYIRGSKYGTHMEEKLAVKENSVEILEKQLATRARKGQHGIIVLASATEPYLQIEGRTGLTRKFLELILKYRFPVHVITRSDLVLRDFDLLREIDRVAILPSELAPRLSNKVFLTFSFSTLDDKAASIFEPGATRPSLRVKTLERALADGFHAGVSLMPLLPMISDDEQSLENFFRSFHHAGARYLFPAGLTLFGSGRSDSKTLFMAAVRKHYPEITSAYEKLFEFGFSPGSLYQSKLKSRIENARKKYPVPPTLFQR